MLLNPILTDDPWMRFSTEKSTTIMPTVLEEVNNCSTTVSIHCLLATAEHELLQIFQSFPLLEPSDKTSRLSNLIIGRFFSTKLSEK
jgi:hypothetical protein